MSLKCFERIDTIAEHKIQKINVLAEPVCFQDCAENSIKVDVENAVICFKIQNGPRREVGVNGVDIDCLAYALRDIIRDLDGQFPDSANIVALSHINSIIDLFDERRTRRMARGVEGFNRK